jgi:hypothetical protein
VRVAQSSREPLLRQCHRIDIKVEWLFVDRDIQDGASVLDASYRRVEGDLKTGCFKCNVCSSAKLS